MLDTAITTVSNTVAAGSGDPSSLLYDTVLLSFASNPLMVGTAWMISSTIFTTYSTTKFIKYKKEKEPTSVVLEAADTRHHHPFWIRQQQQRLRQWKKRIQLYKTNPRLSKSQHPYSSSGYRSNNIPAQQPQLRQSPLQISDTSTAIVPTRILSPSSLLTMYRFAGSLLLGLLFSSTNGSVVYIPQRFYDTIVTIPALLIPSICLFIANFSNTYVVVDDDDVEKILLSCF
jgi:hypothetical protein